MYQFILLIHVFAAIFVIALVLVQQGKGATMGAAFGSGASQTVFGSRGSGSFLFRVTMGLMAIFFVTSLALNYIASSAYKQEKVITLPMVPTKAAAPVTEQHQTVPAKPADTIPVRKK
jgi:preprotein translocase subunit SecG